MGNRRCSSEIYIIHHFECKPKISLLHAHSVYFVPYFFFIFCALRLCCCFMPHRHRYTFTHMAIHADRTLQCNWNILSLFIWLVLLLCIHRLLLYIFIKWFSLVFFSIIIWFFFSSLIFCSAERSLHFRSIWLDFAADSLKRVDTLCSCALDFSCSLFSSVSFCFYYVPSNKILINDVDSDN